MKRLFILFLCLTFLGGAALAEDAVSSATLSVTALPQRKAAESPVLVAYFSTDDTIRAAAFIVADTLSADLFEIQPAEPYTDEDLNYRNSDSRATVEQRDSTARPALSALPDDVSRYDTLILGYPIWWGQAPKIIDTFLESIDTSGLTIIPFCTSGSSGVGNSDTNLYALTDDSAVWRRATRIDNGNTENDIRAWASSLGIFKEEAKVFYIHVNGAALPVTPSDNSSAEALLALLRQGDVSVSMRDYGNFEKVGPLGTNLPRNDEDVTTAPGDVILYQGNQITIYYDVNRWDFTKLGHMDGITQAELKTILGSGDITAVLSLNP